MQIITDTLPYAEFLDLYRSAKIAVKYDNLGAISAAQAGLIFSKSPFFFYLSPISLIVSIILSFFMYWWLFIPGIILSVFFASQMKYANIKALKNAVLSSEQIYFLACERTWIRIYKI